MIMIECESITENGKSGRIDINLKTLDRRTDELEEEHFCSLFKS